MDDPRILSIEGLLSEARTVLGRIETYVRTSEGDLTRSAADLQMLLSLTAGKLDPHQTGVLNWSMRQAGDAAIKLRSLQIDAVHLMDSLDGIRNLVYVEGMEVRRLYRDEQANYERNHVLQEELDDLRATLKERGIVL